MDEARLLDLQDRFINTKCTKYMIRAHDIDKAEKTIALFARVRSIQLNLTILAR
jgi:peptide alpha-N-acetyltransferase